MSSKIKTLYDLAVEKGKINPTLEPVSSFRSVPSHVQTKFRVRYSEGSALARRLRYEREEKERQALSDKILKSKRHKND